MGEVKCPTYMGVKLELKGEHIKVCFISRGKTRVYMGVKLEPEGRAHEGVFCLQGQKGRKPEARADRYR